MMRAIIFAAAFVAGIGPALAQDEPFGNLPKAPHRPPLHHRTPPEAIRDLRVAAIQAPAPKPRPAEASAPATGAKLTQAAAQQNPAQVLQAFTLSDLQNALADAQGQTPPDTVAAACYQQLITVVQSPAVNPLPSQAGAFSLFQKARDLKNIVVALQSNNGPLTQLNIACAPLVVDVQTTLIQLGIIGGAVVGTGLIP